MRLIAHRQHGADRQPNTSRTGGSSLSAPRIMPRMAASELLRNACGHLAHSRRDRKRLPRSPSCTARKWACRCPRHRLTGQSGRWHRVSATPGAPAGMQLSGQGWPRRNGSWPKQVLDISRVSALAAVPPSPGPARLASGEGLQLWLETRSLPRKGARPGSPTPSRPLLQGIACALAVAVPLSLSSRLTVPLSRSSWMAAESLPAAVPLNPSHCPKPSET